MKARALRELTRDELRAKETELAEQLFALRLQKVTGQLENPAKVPSVKRDLARVLTVLNEKTRARVASGPVPDGGSRQQP